MQPLIVFLFLAYALTACGTDDKDAKVDPDFKVMLSTYLTYAPDSGNLKKLEALEYKNFSLDDAKAVGGDENTIGICVHGSGQTIAGREIPGSDKWRVEIKPGQVDGYTLQALVYHELGHCLHGLGHVNTAWAIMSPSVRAYGPESEEYWSQNIGQRLYEMFHGPEYAANGR